MTANTYLTRDVWVVGTNTDLTEGLGEEYAMAVTDIKETAVRLAKGKGVQGTDATITKAQAVKLPGTYHWLVPGRIIPASKEDTLAWKRNERKEIVLEKAAAAGLTAEDIQVLMEA